MGRQEPGASFPLEGGSVPVAAYLPGELAQAEAPSPAAETLPPEAP